jgi:hypothetical protein
MTSADACRQKAAELRAIASTTRQLQFERLARAYLHLAAQADRNDASPTFVCEPLPQRDDSGTVVHMSDARGARPSNLLEVT